MKHQFILTPSQLTAYCSCGLFAVESESDRETWRFQDEAKEAFARHVTLKEEFAAQPEPATTA